MNPAISPDDCEDALISPFLLWWVSSAKWRLCDWLVQDDLFLHCSGSSTKLSRCYSEYGSHLVKSFPQSGLQRDKWDGKLGILSHGDGHLGWWRRSVSYRRACTFMRIDRSLRTMVHCIAQGCNNKDKDIESGIYFYWLPIANKALLKDWLQLFSHLCPPNR